MKKSIAVLGLDLGDKLHVWCAIDDEANVVKRGKLQNNRDSIRDFFMNLPPCPVVMEAGTHSPWISDIVGQLGHNSVVANPRRTRAIWDNVRKSDDNDAELLARLGRADIALLHPIQHRSQRVRADLAVIRSRDALVRVRSSLINHARGVVKSFGYRLPSCSSASFAHRAIAAVPDLLHSVLLPVLEQVNQLTAHILDYDREIDRLSNQEHPEAMLLRSVPGVGPLTSLAFVLTLEHPDRFSRSRSVPAYLGLVPRRDQSGVVDKQLPISKSGDAYLRHLLVSCAQYILGPFGPESALKNWGLAIAERGAGRGKRRATVAVARKLAVILHAMWRSNTEYQPNLGQEAA